MRNTLRSVAAVAAVSLTAAIGVQRAQADDATTRPVALAILNLEYVDTSGEPVDQAAAHQRRAADFVSALQRDLTSNGQYRIVAIPCGTAPCDPEMNPFELQKAARAAGAKFVLVAGVHKMSSLIQWAKIQIADEEAGEIAFDRLVTFRGDTDEAWRRAESFVARDILDSSPGFDKKAGAPPQVKLAVFQFELEDFSGGAGIIPENDEDREQLRVATETASRLIAESGRYSLVDVSRADAADVTAHSLRKCDGCDAAIARDLGADQSLVGVVNRVSRMEYGVTFRLRDARTGAVLAVEQTDLRMGANYSWGRGAAWLIKNRLLEKQAQQ
jgi:hypothetical protein